MGLVEVVSNDDTREEVLQLREEYARLMQQNDIELEHLSSQYYAQAEAAKQALEAQSARVVSCDQCGKAISRYAICWRSVIDDSGVDMAVSATHSVAPVGLIQPLKTPLDAEHNRRMTGIREGK